MQCTACIVAHSEPRIRRFKPCGTNRAFPKKPHSPLCRPNPSFSVQVGDGGILDMQSHRLQPHSQALFSLGTIQTSKGHNIYDNTYMSHVFYCIIFTQALNIIDLLVYLVEY